MTPILRTIISIALTAFLCIGPTACKPKGKSTLISTVAGREIRAVIDIGASMHNYPDSATVSFTGHTVTVEQARVLLDGTELAKFPAAASKVEVTVSAGQLTVTADGASVTTNQLSK